MEKILKGVFSFGGAVAEKENGDVLERRRGKRAVVGRIFLGKEGKAGERVS